MLKRNCSAMIKTGSGIIGLLILFVILVAANVIIRNLGLRADLTDEGLYTLSDGTRSYLRKMEHPVTLKFFFSRSSTAVPAQLKAYAKQVEDLLVEYRLASDGNVLVETYDPKVDSDEEDLARRYGIAPQNRNPFGGAPIYFGVAASIGDSEAAIPAFDPATENMLEYNITRLIHRVGHPEKPVLGVMSSLPVLGDAMPPMPGMPPQGAQASPWMAMQELQNDYELRQIDTTVDTIPPDIEGLVLVHPKQLSDRTLFAIDQYVVGGGQLLVFVDPFCIADLQQAPPQQFGMPDAASNLEPLFKAWGIGYDQTKVIADLKSVTRLSAGGGQSEESPVFLTLRSAADNIERTDLLTAQLDMVMIPFGGALTDQTGEAVTFTPLLRASDLAGLIPAFTVQMGPQAIRRELKPAATAPLIAARLTGTFTTAFPDGPPKDEDPEDAATDTDSAADTATETNVIREGNGVVLVIADVDLISDQFSAERVNIFGFQALRPLNDNIALFANAAEQVAGSSDLIGIRSRGTFARPFDRVRELEAAARERWQQKEKTLVAELQEARQRLAQLQQQKDDSQRFILSREQQAEIENFRKEERRINLELRDVQKQLRKDIDRLGIKVKLANIALLPALVIVTGVAYGLRRRRRAES